MKKKFANGIQLFFTVVAFIILYLPCVTSTGPLSSGYREPVSAMYMMKRHTFITVPMVLLFLANAAVCARSIISKNDHKDGRIHSTLAIVLFVYVYYCLIEYGNGWGRYAQFPAAVLEVCLFLAIVVSFLKRSTKIEGFLEANVTGINSTDADELKKYKDLLESGVITQEEFDAKKKQLLGL